MKSLLTLLVCVLNQLRANAVFPTISVKNGSTGRLERLTQWMYVLFEICLSDMCQLAKRVLSQTLQTEFSNYQATSVQNSHQCCVNSAFTLKVPKVTNITFLPTVLKIYQKKRS